MVANAGRFLREMESTCPMRIRTNLTDNCKAFAGHLFDLCKRPATGPQAFDALFVPASASSIA